MLNYNGRGLIFAFEGLDGSGKETHTLMLERRLKEDGFKVLRVDFPSYNTEYSVFVKKYLNGEFKGEISPFVVSMFFSLDRLGVYKTLMEDYLEKGYIILCDRYVYSNLIYQGAKVKDHKKRDELFEWILNFEYVMCSLPREEITFFLDIPIDISLGFIKERSTRDIYEKDEKFLRECYENLNFVGDKYNLFRVRCFQDNRLLSINEINDLMYFKIISMIKV